MRNVLQLRYLKLFEILKMKLIDEMKKVHQSKKFEYINFFSKKKMTNHLKCQITLATKTFQNFQFL